MQDDDQRTNFPDPTHQPGTRKGEEMSEQEGQEAGRYDTETTGAGRQAGTSTGRSSTAINPDDPMHPDSPPMPTP